MSEQELTRSIGNMSLEERREHFMVHIGNHLERCTEREVYSVLNSIMFLFYDNVYFYKDCEICRDSGKCEDKLVVNIPYI